MLDQNLKQTFPIKTFKNFYEIKPVFVNTQFPHLEKSFRGVEKSVSTVAETPRTVLSRNCRMTRNIVAAMIIKLANSLIDGVDRP